MFLVPIGSDAPVYHFPCGTIGLMIASTLVQLGASVGMLPPVPELVAGYGLVHGDGLHPLQWLTSNVLHAGWSHLIGNMAFLWGFGLIVEGKIGWRQFLPVAIGLGVTECLLEQACLPGPGVSFGSSSIVFGLMAMAMVWAPRNELEVMYNVLGLRAGSFDISVLTLSVLMLLKEVAIAVWLRFSVGSEVFHGVGVLLGLGVAVSMLRAGLVDCEGWDLVTLWRASRSKPVLRKGETVFDGRSTDGKTPGEEEARKKQLNRRMRALNRIHTLLSEEDPRGALEEVRRTRQVLDGFQLGKRDLLRLGQALFAAEAWTETVEIFDEFIQRFPAESDVARLLTAEIMIVQQQRPSAAMKHLLALNEETLPPRDHRRYVRLRARAEALIDSGTIELEGRAWE